MALSASFISSTFLSGETPSFSSVPLSRSAATHVRVIRTVTRAAASKQAAASPRKGEPRGIMTPRPVSPEMANLVGVPEISPTVALMHIWAHIKCYNLQDPENKKIVVCDEKLKKIFQGKDRVEFREIEGLITPHFL